MPAVDRLSAKSLCAGLGENVLIGREIIVREETTSTNDDVWQLAKSGGPEGLVLFAEHQTAGRGQRGNVWESAAHKGLWFSILLRPKIAPAQSARLTDWAAKMITATIQHQLLLPATIKPPNDIYVGKDKVAGVLVEMRAQSNAPHLAIVGIGVNVNQQPHDFSPEIADKATSLAIIKSRPVDRGQLAIWLLRDLDLGYRRENIGSA